MTGFAQDLIYAVYKTDSWKGHANNGLLAFDISDPTNVLISGSLNVTDEIGTITSANIVGAPKRVELILTETIANNNYAKIFDVYNKNNMKELDTFETGRVTHKQAIESIYPYIIIASKPIGESQNTIGGIQIYDVDQRKVVSMDASSNFAEPFIVDSYLAPSYIYMLSGGLNPHHLKIFHQTGLSYNDHISDSPGGSIFITSLALLVLIKSKGNSNLI